MLTIRSLFIINRMCLSTDLEPAIFIVATKNYPEILDTIVQGFKASKIDFSLIPTQTLFNQLPRCSEPTFGLCPEIKFHSKIKGSGVSTKTLFDQQPRWFEQPLWLEPKLTSPQSIYVRLPPSSMENLVQLGRKLDKIAKSSVHMQKKVAIRPTQWKQDVLKRLKQHKTSVLN